MGKPMCGGLSSRVNFAVLVVLGTGLLVPALPVQAGGLVLTSASDSGSFGLYYTTSGSNGSPGFNSSGMLTSTGSNLFPALTGNVSGSLQTYSYSSSSPPSTYTNTVAANPAVLPAGFGASSVTGTAAVLLPNPGSEGTDVTRTGVAYSQGTYLQSATSIPSGTVAVSFSQLTATFGYSGTGFSGSVGAVISANAYLGSQAGSYVALAENGTIKVDHGGTITTDSFLLVAAYSSGQQNVYQTGNGLMSSSGPNSQGEVTITGTTTTNLFPVASLSTGDSVTITANLTLLSDPGSLIELGSLNNVPGPLPTIGIFGGSPSVPEPASLVELGTGVLMLTCTWGWRKARSRKRPDSVRNSSPAPYFLLLMTALAAFSLLLAESSAVAGTITINDADQPISISSSGFSNSVTANNSILQQVTYSAQYLSDDVLLAPNQRVTYDVVFLEPSATGSGFPDRALTEITITGLNDSTSVPNTSVSVFFEGIITAVVDPAPGVYFITEPGGFFDVAAYLRGQDAAGVPADLSVLVATASVPEPSSLLTGRCGRADRLGSHRATSQHRPTRGSTALRSITSAQEVNWRSPGEQELPGRPRSGDEVNPGIRLKMPARWRPSGLDVANAIA